MVLDHPASQKWCAPRRENAKLNGEVLLPCLTLLSETPDFHLPHLPPLQAEIQTLFDAMGKETKNKFQDHLQDRNGHQKAPEIHQTSCQP